MFGLSVRYFVYACVCVSHDYGIVMTFGINVLCLKAERRICMDFLFSSRFMMALYFGSFLWFG